MKKNLLKNDESFESIAMMLLIVVGIAVIVGYLGTRYVVYPVFLKEETKSIANNEKLNEQISKDLDNEKVEVNTQTNGLVVQTETENGNKSVSTTNSSFCVFHVQLGKFQEEDNAQVLIKELNEKAIQTYTLVDSGYKVVTLPFASYEEAETMRKKVSPTYKDAFILKREVLSGEDENVDKLFK
ncbi:MAG: SPOR domain-containing protein [Peptostreptococcales bacterium]